MELKQLAYGIWTIYYNGRPQGTIQDHGSEWVLNIHYKAYDIPKTWYTKKELKDFVRRMIEWNALEVYSEERAIRRGFKIIG